MEGKLRENTHMHKLMYHASITVLSGVPQVCMSSSATWTRGRGCCALCRRGDACEWSVQYGTVFAATPNTQGTVFCKMAVTTHECQLTHNSTLTSLFVANYDISDVRA